MRHDGCRPNLGERTSRTVSRILYPPVARRMATIHLRTPLPVPSCGLPGSSGGPPSNASCLALLRVGFTEPRRSPATLVVSYTTVSPLPAPTPRGRTGGLFSVALSRGSPRVGVTHHPALWSPDFPRRALPRPAGSCSTRPPVRLVRGQRTHIQKLPRTSAWPVAPDRTSADDEGDRSPVEIHGVQPHPHRVPEPGAALRVAHRGQDRRVEQLHLGT